jgi:HK97 family phage portal protein
MKLFGLDISLSQKLSVDELVSRIDAVYHTAAGIDVTPDNCEGSPTVQAIVNAITSRMATMPVHVYEKKTSAGRTSKKLLPNHPVERLLHRPNEWQTDSMYWLDATSRLVRWGKHFAFKARGVTGPIRRLEPIHPGRVELEQGDNMRVLVKVRQASGRPEEFALDEIHHARGRARDSLNGDSPVLLCREAIALELAAQKHGGQVFANGAMPGLIFKYAQNARGTEAQRREFLEKFQEKYSGKGRLKALFLPPGVETAPSLDVENEKAEFVDARKLQRNIIAGAFGVPPHLVGDLENGTLNNVEQQSRDFDEKVILPIVGIFESSMERDLLTDDDRRAGVIIRFNMNASQRATFKEQQEALKIQREMGVINADEWREMVGMNPLPAGQGGGEFWRQGPSGQSATPNAEPKKPGSEDDANEDA